MARVTLAEEQVLYGSEAGGPPEPWDPAKFSQELRVAVTAMQEPRTADDPLEWAMEFDLAGVDAAVANTLRRVLIAEVPTMAIETVIVGKNTSLLPDEMLAHRLGLVPLKADPRLFQNADHSKPLTENTIDRVMSMNLSVKAAREKKDDAKGVANCHFVYSKDIKYRYKEEDWQHYPTALRLVKDTFKAVHDDIVIAKLAPGQELELEMQAIKGIGKEHAKWSPVATATYRLLPVIEILEDVYDEEAEKLQKCFVPGVIDLVPAGSGRRKAVVKDARRDTGSREVFRHEGLKDKVRMDRLRNHFLFQVESTGALAPDVLVVEALKVLHDKCDILLKFLNTSPELDPPTKL